MAVRPASQPFREAAGRVAGGRTWLPLTGVQPGLECDVRPEADAVVIVVSGELDMTSTSVLENAVELASTTGPGVWCWTAPGCPSTTRWACQRWSGTPIGRSRRAAGW
jgi:hypothetical protein